MYKLCLNLTTVKGFGFVCKVDLKNYPKSYRTAPCMCQVSSKYHIKQEKCKNNIDSKKELK